MSVNITAVPQRSPFRYPGGKTWLVPKLRNWLNSLSFKPKLFIEPFVGGGILSLTVACENLAEHVIMADIDDDVAAVWQTIINGDGEELANLIRQFDLSIDSYYARINITASSKIEQAFQTILRNRVAHGGILAPGAGIIKSGESGKGIRSRWYPETLYKRILEISAERKKITFIQQDAFQVLGTYFHQKEAVWLLDPPYTLGNKKAGRRLYKHSEIDHDKLFEFASNLSAEFLMTYENDEKVVELALKRNFDILPISMKSRQHAEMTELLIGRNLDWAR